LQPPTVEVFVNGGSPTAVLRYPSIVRFPEPFSDLSRQQFGEPLVTNPFNTGVPQNTVFRAQKGSGNPTVEGIGQQRFPEPFPALSGLHFGEPLVANLPIVNFPAAICCLSRQKFGDPLLGNSPNNGIPPTAVLRVHKRVWGTSLFRGFANEGSPSSFPTSQDSGLGNHCQLILQ